MTPAELQLVIHSISLLETLIPRLNAALTSGNISAEDQTKLLDRVDALKRLGATAFEADHWKKSTE